MNVKLSTKRLQISQTQSKTLLIVTGAVVISVFCLVSAKQLWSQASFQRHVINERRDAANQLKANVDVATQLQNRYQAVFVNSGSQTNVLGGKNTANPKAVPPDGDNPQIVSDALPTTYDYPALVSSISQIMTNNSINSPNIGGSDQSASIDSKPSSDPQPKAITISLSGSASTRNVQRLIKDMERSIRPIDITSLQLSGNNNFMNISMSFKTYFQPAKQLIITTETIR